MRKIDLNYLFCAFLMLILLCNAQILKKPLNQLWDEEVNTAPRLMEFLNLRNSRISLIGKEFSIFDTASPIPTNQVLPGKNFLPLKHLYDNQTQEFYAETGNTIDGSRLLVNSTDTFFLLYVSTNPTGPICFRIANFTYEKVMQEFGKMRRTGSVRKTDYANQIKLKNQIDNAFGKKNKRCTSEPDVDVFDTYVRMINDAGSPGGFSGAQKTATSHSIYINRYAYRCYNQSLIVKDDYTQFFPFLRLPFPEIISPENVFLASNIFDSFVAPTNDRSYRTQFNQFCVNAPDFATNFFNNDCPFPNQPTISCFSFSKN